MSRAGRLPMSTGCRLWLRFSKLSSSFVGFLCVVALWRAPVLLPLALAGARAFAPMDLSRPGQRCVATGGGGALAKIRSVCFTRTVSWCTSLSHCGLRESLSPRAPQCCGHIQDGAVRPSLACMRWSPLTPSGVLFFACTGAAHMSVFHAEHLPRFVFIMI